MKAKKKRIFAVLLSAAMCLGLLSGCGGDTSGAGGGNKNDAPKANKAWTNTVLYLTNDGEWKLTQNLDGKTDGAIILDGIHTGEEDLFNLDAIFTPVSMGGVYYSADKEDSYTWADEMALEVPQTSWYGADGKHLYFLSGMSGRYLSDSTLYVTNTEARETVAVSEAVATHSVLPSEDGVAYLAQGENGYDLYVCDGAAPIRLATNVYEFFAPNKDGIYFIREISGAYDVLHVSADGNSSPVTLANGVSTYYFGKGADTLFYCIPNDDNYTSTVWSTTNGAEPEVVCEDCYAGKLLSVKGNTFFYFSLNEDESVPGTFVLDVRFFDGKDMKVLGESDRGLQQHTVEDLGWQQSLVDVSRYYDHEKETMVFLGVRWDEQTNVAIPCVRINSVNGVEMIDIDCELEQLGQAHCCGTADDGKTILIYIKGHEPKLLCVQTDGEGSRSVVDGCHLIPTYIPGTETLYYFLTPSADDLSHATVANYLGESLKEIVTDLNLMTSHFYDDGTILYLAGESYDVGTLTQYADGETTVIAENVEYYLRRQDGSILFVCDGTLYLSKNGTEVRLADDVCRFYCGNADYGHILGQVLDNNYQW